MLNSYVMRKARVAAVRRFDLANWSLINDQSDNPDQMNVEEASHDNGSCMCAVTTWQK